MTPMRIEKCACGNAHWMFWGRRAGHFTGLPALCWKGVPGWCTEDDDEQSA